MEAREIKIYIIVFVEGRGGHIQGKPYNFKPLRYRGLTKYCYTYVIPSIDIISFLSRHSNLKSFVSLE